MREVPSNLRLGFIQLAVILLLAGDLELNPGPQPTGVATISTQPYVMGLPFNGVQFATFYNNPLIIAAMPYLPLALSGLSAPVVPSFAVDSECSAQLAMVMWPVA